MAGGTGGHVYPALAIADYLRESGVPLFWLGTQAGLESRVVPENNIKLITINVSGLRGKKINQWIFAPFILMLSFMQSLRVILNIKPSVVIGMGGFVSGPGGIAAWLLRIPLYIHEQNSIAGTTNKLLSPFAKTVMQGFPGSMNVKRVVTTGNPVRKEILENIKSPAERFEGRVGMPLRLLVIGGSLGAKVLNELLPRVIAGLPQDVEVDIWHQTGIIHHDATMRLYKENNVNPANVVPYITNMAEAYLWSDLIICRAGAMTISEISTMGLASILVPYPHAVDDHQTANARYLSDHDAAILVPQVDLNKFRIIELISEFYTKRISLIDMATLVQSLSLPNATRDIVNICMEDIYV
ncbi:MAG: undecaprenyldiphospho-muramoylpentapeptide beta-N-acetylglucosaminyltransferase [Gammaproteobacteria bacterium]|jgi:UDP-N-acetylglucosamine--N-acetylmuramyl-(pentapeptide) pyrophosphoryl-undecaprenol N-acetylglucosamine transferase